MSAIIRYNDQLTGRLIKAMEFCHNHSNFEDTYNKMVLLIRQGADPRVIDSHSNSFLHIAAEVKGFDVYELDEIVVAHKVDFDFLNEIQKCPLEIATYRENITAVKYFVGLGAKISDLLVRHISFEIDYPSNPWIETVLNIFDNSFKIRRQYLHYRRLIEIDTLASRCAIVIRRNNIKIRKHAIPAQCDELVNPFKYTRIKLKTTT